MAKVQIITEFSLSLQSYLEKFIKLAAYSEKRSEKRANFHEKVVTLTLFEVEDRLHLGKTQIKFGFSLDLDNFLTLKNANLFVFSSLNRNFALSLHRDSEKSHP